MAISEKDRQLIEGQFQKMLPFAQQASKNTGVPVPVIMAQWAHETAYPVSGYAHRVPLASPVAKNADNWAGIKKVTNSIAQGNYGAYADYSGAAQFVQDYSRVLGLSYYKAARVPDVGASVKGLAASPWAETHYGGGTSLQYWIDTFNLTRFGSGSAVSTRPAPTPTDRGGAPIVEANTVTVPGLKDLAKGGEIAVGVGIIAAGLFILAGAAKIVIPDFKK